MQINFSNYQSTQCSYCYTLEFAGQMDFCDKIEITIKEMKDLQREDWKIITHKSNFVLDGIKEVCSSNGDEMLANDLLLDVNFLWTLLISLKILTKALSTL